MTLRYSGDVRPSRRLGLAVLLAAGFTMQSMVAHAVQFSREAEAADCCERDCDDRASDFAANRCCGVSPAVESHPGTAARDGGAPTMAALPMRAPVSISAGSHAPLPHFAREERSRSSPVYLLIRSLRI